MDPDVWGWIMHVMTLACASLVEVGVERGRMLLRRGIGGTIFGHICGRTPRRSREESQSTSEHEVILECWVGEASVGDAMC